MGGSVKASSPVHASNVPESLALVYEGLSDGVGDGGRDEKRRKAGCSGSEGTMGISSDMARDAEGGVGLTLVGGD